MATGCTKDHYYCLKWINFCMDFLIDFSCGCSNDNQLRMTNFSNFHADDILWIKIIKNAKRLNVCIIISINLQNDRSFMLHCYVLLSRKKRDIENH